MSNKTIYLISILLFYSLTFRIKKILKKLFFIHDINVRALKFWCVFGCTDNKSRKTIITK